MADELDPEADIRVAIVNVAEVFSRNRRKLSPEAVDLCARLERELLYGKPLPA